MATDPNYRLLTAEEFLSIDFGPDMKAELDEGIIRMMTGSNRRHSHLQTNLVAWIGMRLRGSGYHLHASSMAVRTHDRSVRYPDLTIDCGSPDDRPRDRVLTDPRVIIEILSPSTRTSDLRVKREEYRALPGVATIAFVDPDAETIAVLQRIDGGWTESLFSTTLDLDIPSLGLTIPRAEIFATD